MRTYSITGCGQSPTETRFWFVTSKVNRKIAEDILEKLRAAVKGPKEHWGTNTLYELDPEFAKNSDHIRYDLHEVDLDYTPPESTTATSMSIVPLTPVGFEYRFLLDGTPVSLWEFARELPYEDIKEELRKIHQGKGIAEYEVRTVYVTGCSGK